MTGSIDTALDVLFSDKKPSKRVVGTGNFNPLQSELIEDDSLTYSRGPRT